MPPLPTVADVLLDLHAHGRRMLYRPGIGNAGDALIGAGFYHLAQRLDLPFTELPGAPLAVPDLGPDDVLVLSGGSWLASAWDFGPRVIDSLTRFDAPLMLLPQSLSGNEEALRRLRPQDVLFVRERYSYDVARSLDLRCPVHLDHDMALSLDPRLLLQAPLVRRPRGRHDLTRVAAIARHRALSTRQHTLAAWRVDAESTGAHPEAAWRDDLSLVTNFSTLDRASVELSGGWLLRVLSWYERVRTDRLHVGIGAALLGKPVELHANSYHKIRGIYEYSLRDDPRLGPLVRFVDAS